MSNKLRVGVIFGGRSGEHEVSLRSAHSIINAMDKNKYDVVPIGITKQGGWLIAKEAIGLLPETVMNSTEQVALIGDPTHQGLIHVNGRVSQETEKFDVFFPVLHGTYGEDGTIQGLLEMADIAYVGCGVLASATGMDKVVMKRLFVANGLPVGPFIWFLRTTWEKDPSEILTRIETELGYPSFVKPANLGSSVGISKAKDRQQLEAAIELAIRYDRKIIVEKGINARELEISVLGNDEPIASLPGEVIPGAEFYDYNDKYLDNKTQFEIPAKLPASSIAEMQQLAIQAFQAIDGSGLARVDFFLERDTDRLILNEINTLPGFTSISMYPKLWEASGISYSELIDRLIVLAIDRHKEKSRSVTNYQPDQA
ncbi:MAG: D-alanine--D-alanine ligase [Acidobacteriota bacterium]